MNEKKEIYLFSHRIELSAIKTFESSLYYIRRHTLKCVCTEKKTFQLRIAIFHNGAGSPGKY